MSTVAGSGRTARRWGIADVVILTGMAVNAVVIVLILYFYVF